MSFEQGEKIPSTEKQVLSLLRQAASAHSNAFAHVNSYDPDWPQWYADFIVQPLSEFLDRPVNPQQLASVLAALDIEQRQQAPDSDWAIYYAPRLVLHYDA